MTETGREADFRRLRAFRAADGSVAVPPQLAGWVLHVLLTDLGEQRRRRMGTIRSDILELLDALHPVASDIGSLSIPQDRMLMAEVGDSQPVLLSVTRVADRLGLSTRAVTNMLTSGRLHGSKDIDGRHWVVSEEDLNNYMNGKAA